MKKIITFIILAGMCFALIGCNADTKTAESTDVLENMSKYKTAFVGDNSKVGSQLQCLPALNDKVVQKMFAIQSENEPYGITIYYEPKEEFSGFELQKTETMKTYADYLFKNISNLKYVEFAYRKTPSGNVLEKDQYNIMDKIEKG